MNRRNLISIAKKGSPKYIMHVNNAKKQTKAKLNTIERLRDKLFLKQMEKIENQQQFKYIYTYYNNSMYQCTCNIEITPLNPPIT